MQRGCLKRINRKRGPDVWQFRWPETNPKGRRLYPKKIIGTLEQFPEENAARRRVAGLITEINATERSPSSSTMTIGQLCDPFEQSISFIRARGAAQPVPVTAGQQVESPTKDLPAALGRSIIRVTRKK
jgi:hypothetical protein